MKWLKCKKKTRRDMRELVSQDDSYWEEALLIDLVWSQDRWKRESWPLHAR